MSILCQYNINENLSNDVYKFINNVYILKYVELLFKLIEHLIIIVDKN